MKSHPALRRAALATASAMSLALTTAAPALAGSLERNVESGVRRGETTDHFMVSNGNDVPVRIYYSVKLADGTVIHNGVVRVRAHTPQVEADFYDTSRVVSSQITRVEACEEEPAAKRPDLQVTRRLPLPD